MRHPEGASDTIIRALAQLGKRRAWADPIGRQLACDASTRATGQNIQNCALRILAAVEQTPSGDARPLLEAARLCNARLCAFCEWRRSRAWRARLCRGLADFARDRPTDRAIFLTLTVRNCPISEMGETLDLMNRGWNRLTKRSSWPTPFWFRRTEVTIGRGDRPSDPAALGLPLDFPAADSRKGSEPEASRPAGRLAPAASFPPTAHPHFHALLLVPAGYFCRGYLSHTKWRALWQDCARLDYAPIVDVRAVKDRGLSNGPPVSDSRAVLEVAKYCAKHADIAGLGSEAVELHHQLRGRRLVAVSSGLSRYVASRDPAAAELLDTQEAQEAPAGVLRVLAQWDRLTGAYEPVS